MGPRIRVNCQWLMIFLIVLGFTSLFDIFDCSVDIFVNLCGDYGSKVSETPGAEGGI